MKNRIIGFDFARAFAIFIMVFVNFKTVMNATEGPRWLLFAVELLEGRGAAMFVILAGIGISLMTAKARILNDAFLLKKNRMLLLKRACLLIIIGLLYSFIWPADILHFYGFYLAIAAFLFATKDRYLWLWAAGFTIGFVLLLFLFDYETGWDLVSLTYRNFWSPEGMIRHIFFNGFHPVFPWTAFLFIGIWAGRLNFNDRIVRNRLLVGSLAVWVCAECISKQLASFFLLANIESFSPEYIKMLFATNPMPPLPQYILAAGSLALFVITLCVSITLRYSNALWVDILCKTGRISLTLYVAHVVIGMGLLEVIGRLYNQSIDFSVCSALIFNICAVIFALFCINKIRIGPLEWIFRKLAK